MYVNGIRAIEYSNMIMLNDNGKCYLLLSFLFTDHCSSNGYLVVYNLYSETALTFKRLKPEADTYPCHVIFKMEM